MDPTNAVALLLLWMTLLAAFAFWFRSWQAHRQVERRLQSPAEDQPSRDQLSQGMPSGLIGRWLFRAGYRSRNAVPIFLSLSLLGLLTGAAVVSFLLWSGVDDVLERLLVTLPGGVGEVFLPLAWASPWGAAGFLASLPALVVASRRKKRVQQIEQDLPLTLDLLATLAEAGLSFDSALDRILMTQPRERPLATEFRLFQMDILAGRGRIDALRRLLRRVEVPWFSIFISAVMHAEQVGSSLAQTLRAQADDLRVRRRERALAFAMAVPVRLLGPLIICFLPGIMTATLGPIVYQIVQVLDSFLQGALAS
ncbi:MAG: type II secretion system F family protein [Maioricimonas sp. JB045]